MTPHVSIVTLTHNKLAVSQRCLPTLFKTRGKSTWDLVIVDNGSTDGTVEWLDQFQADARRHGASVTLIKNRDNVGCSTARNQGIEAAQGDYVAFIDNDVAVRSSQWIDQFVAVFHATPAVGIVGPKLVYPTPPHNIQCAGVGISQRGRVQFRGRGEPRNAPEFNQQIPVQTLISACFMVRRDLLTQYGGFDEAFNPVEFEDFDLCYRIREKQWLAIYEPAVEMYHLESVTTQGTASLPNTALIIRNGLEFKRRWKHMFSTEEGPADELTRWRKLPATDPANLGDMPIL